MCRRAAAPGQLVVHEMAVAKALEQATLAKLLQVLRHARLTLPCDLRQLRHAAFAFGSQRDEPQPYRVCERLELRNQLLDSLIH